VHLWFERYILPICAAIVFGVVILNPLKLDWPQRLSLLVAISAFAYFLAHTIHKPKASIVPDSDQRFGFLERQIENIQSQQKQLESQQANAVAEKQRKYAIKVQLAQFLKEGQKIQNSIRYNDRTSLHEKQTWEDRVEEYLKKSVDETYAVRFRSPSHQVTSYPFGVNTDMLAPWGDMGGKMAMLNDFISELRE
jgi:hypothetical protein